MIQATEITMVPIDEVIPYSKNPNRHSKEQIDRLVDLIKYHGFRVPLVVDIDTSIIATGHGRLEAAKQMGMTEIPVIFQKFDNSEQFYSFVVSDNAISSWAELDIPQIQMMTLDMGPDFNTDNLGIKNFFLPNVTDKGFDPSSEENEKPHKLCPHCGEEL